MADRCEGIGIGECEDANLCGLSRRVDDEDKPAMKRLKVDNPEASHQGSGTVNLAHLSRLPGDSLTSEATSTALSQVTYHIVSHAAHQASNAVTQALTDASAGTDSAIQIVPVQPQESASVREMVSGSAVMDEGGGSGSVDLLGGDGEEGILDPVLVVGPGGLGEATKDEELTTQAASSLDTGSQHQLIVTGQQAQGETQQNFTDVVVQYL